MKPLTPLQAEVHRRRSEGESVAHISRTLGVGPGTVNKHATRAAEKLGVEPREPLPHPQKAVIPEPLPNDVEEYVADLPDYEKVKRRLRDHNPDYIDRFYRHRHQRLAIPHAPTCLFFMGDPHMDSPGHDIAQFEADLALIRNAQAEFPCISVQMGDVLDHWPTGGRLGKKHLHSHLTRKEALSLVRGLAQEEGIDWALWLVGNHDEWPGIDYETLIRGWLSAPLVDWAAYLTRPAAPRRTEPLTSTSPLTATTAGRARRKTGSGARCTTI